MPKKKNNIKIEKRKREDQLNDSPKMTKKQKKDLEKNEIPVISEKLESETKEKLEIIEQIEKNKNQETFQKYMYKNYIKESGLNNEDGEKKIKDQLEMDELFWDQMNEDINSIKHNLDLNNNIPKEKIKKMANTSLNIMKLRNNFDIGVSCGNIYSILSKIIQITANIVNSHNDLIVQNKYLEKQVNESKIEINQLSKNIENNQNEFNDTKKKTQTLLKEVFENTLKLF